MFGSYALGKAGCHSDVDFLVLLKAGEKVRRIRRILFDFKLSLGNYNESQAPVEIQIDPEFLAKVRPDTGSFQ